MRWEILNLIDKNIENGVIQGPILDVGGNGTEYQKEQGYDFKAKFNALGMEYRIIDILPNPGVDYVMDACGFFIDRRQYHPKTVLCTEMLQHCERPMEVVDSCFRVLAHNGIILVTVPDMYGIRTVQDYWRFNENGLKVLCKKFNQIQYGDFGSEEKRDFEHFFIGRKENTYGMPTAKAKAKD